MKPSLLAAALLLPAAASAELLSQDSFSAYSLGQLPVVIPSPTIAGYTGNWTGIDHGTLRPAVTAGTLTYAGANYAAASGNKVSVPHNPSGSETAAENSGRVFRLLDSSLTVTDSTEGTRYLSFLFQSGQETGATIYQTLALYNGESIPDANRNFDIGLTHIGGQTGTQYNFGADNAYTSTGVAADTNVHLLVVKFVLSASAASDAVTVWVDPDLSAGEPAGGTTVTGKDLTWDRLVLSDYDGNSCAWDEIRWGTTFDSVTTESFLPAIPHITQQPADFTGFVGSPFSISATAESDPPPTYQWEYSQDGVNGWTEVDGADEATFGYPFAVYSDNGYYRVVASNANGSDTSDAAKVTLTFPKPTITAQPVSLAKEQGSDAIFSVTATGVGSLSYQWYKDGEEIEGETSATLTLTNVQASDEGEYEVEIIDHAAEEEDEPATFIFSNLVTLTVFEPWSGLVSHDPFDIASGYAIGELPGQNPTIAGYTGPWVDINGGDAEPAIAAGSLIYPNPLYLGSSGDKVAVPSSTSPGEIDASNSGRAYRLFDTPLVVDADTAGTRYLSFLFQSGQETGATVYQMLSLSSANTGDGVRPFDIGITTDGGQTGTNYNFGVSGAYTSTGVAADTNVHLFVVKFDLSAEAGGDSVTVWIDPTLGSGEPAGGITVTGANLTWNKMFISDYDGNSAAWDEIRWGSTFDSVTLNPNPADDYATWIGGYPVGGMTGFDEDADGDGIDNGVESIFGTNPGVSNQGIVEIARSGNTVTFQHPQGTPPSDVSASYIWSTDLVTFHADGESDGGVTVDFTTSTEAGTTTVTATITGTVPARLFVTLKATRTTP